MHKFILTRPCTGSVLRLELFAEDLLRQLRLDDSGPKGWLIADGNSVTLQCAECHQIRKISEMSSQLFRGEKDMPICRECEQQLRPILVEFPRDD